MHELVSKKSSVGWITTNCGPAELPNPTDVFVPSGPVDNRRQVQTEFGRDPSDRKMPDGKSSPT